MGISRACVFDVWSHASIILTSAIVKSNVLIDQTGNARLADFGLLTILSDPANHLSSSSFTQGGSARWMSPELIDPQRFGLDNSRPTKSSDCYALGMVIYETISGHLPFHQHADLTVFVKVLAGERPARGAGFAESLWKVLAQCWTPQSNDRPSIQDVLRCLGRVLNSPEPTPFGLDEEMEGDCDEWDSGDDYSGIVSPFTPPRNVSRSQCLLLPQMCRFPHPNILASTVGATRFFGGQF